ncbi:MAG: hypothetical protein O3A47_12140 [Chloroflexi bacterium]|nr:hypothetical protein [Chloroflexota bacterium]
MPEAPDLVVIKEFLAEHIVAEEVVSARVLKPSVVRSLAGDFQDDIQDRTVDVVDRRGKWLIFRLSGARLILINPMLTGALQYCGRRERVFNRTCVILELVNGWDLRYVDDKQMGMVYYVAEDQLEEVPRIGEQGPDVLDEFSFESFQERLRKSPGEIKGILTRGKVISGIGNAYADEILFEAQVYPFRKRKALSVEEQGLIYEKAREVVEEAVLVLRERMGDRMHKKVRDFLKVHNRGGQPCPRCGGTISQLTANRRITSYCRKCQPGMLIGR